MFRDDKRDSLKRFVNEHERILLSKDNRACNSLTKTCNHIVTSNIGLYDSDMRYVSRGFYSSNIKVSPRYRDKKNQARGCDISICLVR